MDALDVRDVCKRYGTGTSTGSGGQVIAAGHVTFTVGAGAFVALTGDLQLTQDRPVEDIIRHISQLG